MTEQPRIKNFKVTFPDGSQWLVPNTVPAESYAEYYATRDAGSAPVFDPGQDPAQFEQITAEHAEARAAWETAFDTAYQNHYIEALANDAEMIDWLPNNMNWSDVAPKAVRLPPSPIDYEELWGEAEIEVVG